MGEKGTACIIMYYNVKVHNKHMTITILRHVYVHKARVLGDQYLHKIMLDGLDFKVKSNEAKDHTLQILD